ncbi:MAG: pilus assembly protein [Actinobacteria bacterium]|nr:pilus assembly protein [Actinomycetota bacterium]
MEFALVLPILLVVCLAMVQVGLLVRDRLVLVEAAGVAAREASVNEKESHIWDAAKAAATTLEPDRLSMRVDRAGSRGDPVTVTLSYRAPVRVPLVDWLFPGEVPMTASATMRQEFGP